MTTTKFTGQAYQFDAPVTLQSDPTVALHAATKQYVDNSKKSYSATIGDGTSTTITVTHNLGVTDVDVSIFELTGNKRKIDSGVEIRSISTTQISLIFATAPASNSLRVNVFSSGGTSGTTDPYTFFDPDYAPVSPSTYNDEFTATSLDGKWTTVNWASATTKDVNTSVADGLYIQQTNTGTTVVSILQALPAGDFTIFTKTALGTGATPNCNCGLILSSTNTASSGTQYILGTGAYLTTGFFAQVYSWTNFATAGSAVAGAASYGTYRWLRIRRSGSNYYWAWSIDGKTWDEVAYNPAVAPAYIGLFTINQATTKADFSFEFFRYFPSATATLGAQRTLNSGANTDVYSTVETLTNKVWIDGKPIYRKVINFGALPNATTKNVAHGISGLTAVITYEGYSYNSGTTTWLPLPYVGSVSGWVTEISVTSTDLTIKTGANLSAYASTYVVMEYTK